MALATRCPHCKTTFRVAHDQLKLRSGMVRCGACSQVFNGVEHLLRPGEEQQASPASAPVSVPASTPAHARIEPAQSTVVQAPPSLAEPGMAPTASTRPGAATKPVSTPPVNAPDHSIHPSAVDYLAAGTGAQADAKGHTFEHAVDFDLSPAGFQSSAKPGSTASTAPAAAIPTATPQSIAGPVSAPVPFSAPATESAVEAAAIEPQGGISLTSMQPASEILPETRAAIPEAPPDATPEASPEPDSSAPADEPPAPQAAETDADDLALPAGEADEPSFVRRARRQQRRARLRKVMLGIGSLVLLIVFMLHGVYLFRSQLQTRFPELKPMLAQACQKIDCGVRLATQIDAISLESSELQTVTTNKNNLSLSMLLRNRSAQTQAWPHIELTLNDATEQALVRRVFVPREYLGAGQDSTKGFDPDSEQSIKLYFTLTQLKASGYRVLLFYP